jgi:hypothetical protein
MSSMRIGWPCRWPCRARALHPNILVTRHTVPPAIVPPYTHTQFD